MAKKKKRIWKPVSGYDVKLEVSNFGELRSIKEIADKNGKVYITEYTKRKMYVSDTGYHVVGLIKNHKHVNRKVHRLEMIAFNGIDPERPVVNHKDGNKLNNDLDNLEWSTSSENNVHAIKTGLRSYDKIKREYHAVIDDLDITALGAKKVAKELHKHGYFTDVKIENLKAGIHNSASNHTLYKGILKVEYTDDPYDDIKEYPRCAIKGRLIQADINGEIVKAKGPAKLADKMQEKGYWTDKDRTKLIKKISEAALRDGICYGIRVRYLEK